MMFSIIVPVYNTEQYLLQCIESILGQTEQDFELILVNDGSVDSSGIICEDYQRKLPSKIKVVHQKNKGSFLSRRAAIELAKGNYCIFVDSDDYLRNDALKIIKQTIVENNVDVVIYNYIRVTDKGCYIRRPPFFPNRATFTKENKSELYEKIINDHSVVNLVLDATKRDLLNNNYNYSEVLNLCNAEDLLQILPIFTNAKKIIFINEYLYYYRQNISSITHIFNASWFASQKYVHKQLIDYVKTWGFDDNCGLLRHRYINIIRVAILQITNPGCTWNMHERIKYLERLANDEYFIDAYDNNKDNNIPIIWRFIMSLLRKKRILMVLFITYSKRVTGRNK